jgi:flagellar hook-associated protein 3 FlgL
MNRISSASSYSAILANIQSAQQRQVEAGNQVSSGKIGTNLKDYASKAEVLTAMQTVDARLTTYTDQNKVIASKLQIQDLSLNKVADAADATRQAIANALANDNATTLMQDLQAQFSNAVGGLNAEYDGKYLFAGGQVSTPPVSATQLSDLTLAPGIIANQFHNDTYVAQAKLDDSTTVNTGMLADQLGTNMLTAFQSLEAFHQGANGPFSGQLTAAQRTFLEGQLATWTTVHTDLTTATALNGNNQARVDSVQKYIDSQQLNIKTILSDNIDVNLAEASTRLNLAQQSLQASAQAFRTLQDSSLLNYLK